MPHVYKKSIIKLLKHTDYIPVKLARLAKDLGVNPEDYPQFKEVFDQLQQAGHIIIGSRNLISLPSMASQITGTFKANPKGFGFIIPLEPNLHGDLFIPAKATGTAITGDIVTAKVMKKGKRTGQMRYTGKIIDILQRAQNRFVGTLLKKPEGWIVHPDGTGFVEPITVNDIAAKNAKPKDKVVVEILSYPTQNYLARGVIVEVLGKAGSYESEIQSIIRQYHLPDVFDADCIAHARDVTAAFDPKNLTSREDITEKVIITIDPPSAKDFDDAISLEKDTDGNCVLGVHIADVSHFIPADSPLNTEAKDRGNSAYLPGKTIPMLPEILSNGICSLQPNQLRFVKSAYITYDPKGNIIARRFANSAIKSTQRLTYQEADKILKGHTKGTSREVIDLLKNMEALSRVIEKRRRKNGMIHLDLPETELIMDKSGRVIDARPADDSYPHTIIEMFMVEANDAVASLLDRLNVEFIRRIHPEPDVLSMKNLSKLVHAFGLSMPRTPDRAAMQSLLSAVKDMDCSFAVNIAVLRSLEKAEYSPLHIGHYALASTHYCHFTSPIRRYADLLVHRALETYLQNGASLREQPQDLAEIGKHISFAEQRAEDAERELKTVLILQMLSKHIGKELDCIISGIAGFGIFAQCRKFGIEGLIRTEDLGPDDWKFSQKTQCLVGLRSGQTIHLGHAMKVRIVSVNIPARQLNLSPTEPLGNTSRQQNEDKITQKRKKQRTSKRQKRKR